MKKAKSIIIKTLIVIALLIMNFMLFFNSVIAAENIDAANIYSAGDCGNLLKYKGIYVKVYYAEYVNNGVVYPAYCLDKTKHRSR